MANFPRLVDVSAGACGNKKGKGLFPFLPPVAPCFPSLLPQFFPFSSFFILLLPSFLLPATRTFTGWRSGTTLALSSCLSFSSLCPGRLSPCFFQSFFVIFHFSFFLSSSLALACIAFYNDTFSVSTTLPGTVGSLRRSVL